MAEIVFSKLSDDVILTIFFKLEDDPRNWARLACVCTKFASLIRNICWKDKCSRSMPGLLADLLASDSATPPDLWSSLNKLSVCCPGLLHSGLLLENSDFGLERELGPDANYQNSTTIQSATPSTDTGSSNLESGTSADCSWSLFDDLYFDTVYNNSEAQDDAVFVVDDVADCVVEAGLDISSGKKRKLGSRSSRSHLASGVWNLSREQGNKLLASRFRGDCLYISDWPGCVHFEEKRNYMLFRGIFKNFKFSRVWRTLNDGNRSKIDISCAFCSCKETWDLHSAFCLRRIFGYHDDGEPVVRAYVCENGHVSGAWTELPLYTWCFFHLLGTLLISLSVCISLLMVLICCFVITVAMFCLLNLLSILIKKCSF